MTEYRSLKDETRAKIKYIRSFTVEPIFGSLTQFFGMRKINTIGYKEANKVMLIAGTAYNLKKYLKFIERKSVSRAERVEASLDLFIAVLSRRKNHIESL